MLDESKAYEIGNANMKKIKSNNYQNQEEKLKMKIV